MSLTLLAVIGIIVMVALLFLGMNIGIAMLLVGAVGYTIAAGDLGMTLGRLGMVPFTTASTYTYVVIPLFVLMGEFTLESGMSKGLYDACEKWLGRFRGGLNLATIVSCGVFGAICGSSSAAVATMGKLAIPETRRFGYDDSFSAATSAAGGTLSWLIPPSTGFIIYGITASVSVGRLFAAGIIPGVLLMIAYMAASFVVCLRNPSVAPRGETYRLGERLRALRGLLPIAALFAVVIGGMFGGVFSATEAAAVGAFLSILYTALRGKLTWRGFKRRLLSTLRSSIMVFQIMIGAMFFGYFLTITNLPQNLADFIGGLAVSRVVIMFFMLLLYIIIGMFMDTLSVVLLTIPIFYPIVVGLGYDPVWFGVVIVLVMVLGTITPPIGINLFIAAGLEKDIPLAGIMKNIWPYAIALLVVTVLAILVPQLSLWLPNLFYGAA